MVTIVVKICCITAVGDWTDKGIMEQLSLFGLCIVSLIPMKAYLVFSFLRFARTNTWKQESEE